MREIAELKAARDVFLEETTMLNARNEELAQLNAMYARRMEAALPDSASNGSARKQSNSFEAQQPPQIIQPSATSSTNASFTTDEGLDSRFVKVHKPDQIEAPATLRGKFKWRIKQEHTTVVSPDNNDGRRRGKQHNFQQINVLRFTRCDHCGEKLWGSQARCTGACHKLFVEGCFY